MANDAPLFGDLARMAGGAASAFSGAREEFRRRSHDRRARLLERLDLVTREEADRVEAMAVRALEDRAGLADRVAALESRLAALERGSAEPAAPAKPRRKAPAPKATAAPEAGSTKARTAGAKGRTAKAAAAKDSPAGDA